MIIIKEKQLFDSHLIINIGCLTIYGTHVTANNSTNNNVLFFFDTDLKIV